MEKRFTDEELSRANSHDMLDILVSYGLNPVQFSKNTYTTEEHDSLKVTPGEGFRWYSRDLKGGPIQLHMALGNLSWVDAVKKILNESEQSMYNPHPKQKTIKKTPKQFMLPDKNNTYKHMYAYLVKTRGIEKKIIDEFVKKKSIYESLYEDKEKGFKFYNVTFVGSDKNGIPRYASTRSTNTDYSFKGEVEGSNKEYAFSKKGKDSTLYTFESGIEILSFLSLLELDGVDTKKIQSHLLGCGGTSVLPIEKYIDDYNDSFKFSKIVVCTNNDEAGHQGYLSVLKHFGENFKIERLTPTEIDFNDDLILRKGKKLENKKTFSLELRENLTPEVSRYLLDTLQIDKEILKELIEKKQLLETHHGNIAFLSRSEQDEIESAYIISTNTIGERFNAWKEGSLNPFSISNNSQRLRIFKDPVEMLSYLSILKLKDCELDNANYLFVGNNMKMLDHYLEHNQIEKIVICGDEEFKNQCINYFENEMFCEKKYLFNWHHSDSFQNELQVQEMEMEL